MGGYSALWPFVICASSFFRHSDFAIRHLLFMNISAIQPKVDTSHIAVENLAGNSALTEDQKIGEASRQFEAILLRQFLTESQKPCFKSEFTDDSAEAGIYQDMVTNQLADALTRGNGIGLAQTFQHQLTRHGAATGQTAGSGVSTSPALHAAEIHGPEVRANTKISKE